MHVKICRTEAGFTTLLTYTVANGLLLSAYTCIASYIYTYRIDVDFAHVLHHSYNCDVITHAITISAYLQSNNEQLLVQIKINVYYSYPVSKVNAIPILYSVKLLFIPIIAAGNFLKGC